MRMEAKSSITEEGNTTFSTKSQREVEDMSMCMFPETYKIIHFVQINIWYQGSQASN